MEQPLNPAVTSGTHQTLWLDTVPASTFYPLTQNAEAEVVIIGAGISGLTTAYNLCCAGKKVIVLDDGFIGSGESGRTTAHLTCALDDRYYEIESLLGKEAARLAAQSHMQAIQFIENTTRLENINCYFKRVDGYLFLHPTDKAENLDKEYAAVQSAGIPVEMVTTIPGIDLPPGQRGIRFKSQGQFNIMAYLNGLAKAIVSHGGQLYTQSKVTHIDSSGVKGEGFSVSAHSVVVATNSPINNIFTMHTKQAAYRTYVVAAAVDKGLLPQALWWDTGDQESKWNTMPYHYVRLEDGFDNDWLIVGGEDHKTGQADQEGLSETERYERLESWMRHHFPLAGPIHYRWSGQVIEPIDLLAFMGKNPGDDNIYIITGDSGNGMTHGTLGGMIVADLILGRANPYATLYDPSRISWGAAGTFMRESANVAVQYLDWLSPTASEQLESLPREEGTVIASGFDRYAVYRDSENQCQAFSAVCPHMGCIIQWNRDEKSWDCPCHGSRFSKEGTVINGPAISNLKKINLPPKNR